MPGHGIFCLITHKKDAPEGKDPTERIGATQCIWVVFIEGYTIVIDRDQLTAVLNADVTTVLKQVKCSFTKNCYTKLRNSSTETLMKSTSSQSSQASSWADCNSTIIYF